MSSAGATLSGSFSRATGATRNWGFQWGTSSSSLTNRVYSDGLSDGNSFTYNLEGLTPGTTYYYRAIIEEYDAATGNYVDRVSSDIKSFTTSAVQPQTGWQAYLSDYGMPDVSGLGTSLRQSGTYSDRDDKWYSVSTSNSQRQIAIHTYSTGAPSNEETVNYVVLYDGSKYAPVWTAHTMNTTYWPDKKVGRNEDWGSDPAISLTQQTGLDNASSVGYSRGHRVASNYRQTTVKQNKQTFYYSNQAPQWQNSFNSGIWSTLEQKVADSTPSGTTMLYVVTGVLYEGSTKTLPSGSLNVPIPSHFYKCIMKCTFNDGTVSGAQGIAFVFTNEAHSGNYYDSGYVTSIDAIEERAGFDFFAAVPSSLQASAESNTSHNWFTGK